MNSVEVWHLFTIAIGSLAVGCTAVGIMFSLQNNHRKTAIDDVNKRISDTNNRIDDLREIMLLILGRLLSEEELQKMKNKTGTDN